ncbi:MAG: sterol desaturase family protein [Flavobacteriales bacterium]|nr:sterol desaturase family protein [Flavobacteriales bacterium]
MNLILGIFIIIITFFAMELVAWATHKYLMHGLLWKLHKDHHVVDKNKKFQKNDFFFLIFAIPSMILIYIGYEYDNISLFFGLGIALYGLGYFIVHEIIIHQRLRFFKKSNNSYIKSIRMAHKVHHKTLGKHGASSFGMLIVSKKYFKSWVYI